MENRTNPFLRAATFRARVVLSTSIVALALGSAAHAVDYNYGSVTQNFTLTATDQARAIGNNLGTFNDNKGAIYWRGAATDVMYAHFDLALLAGGTINGTVNLNFSRTTCPARTPKTTAPPSPAGRRLRYPVVQVQSSLRTLRAQASTRSKSPSPKAPKPNSSVASKW